MQSPTEAIDELWKAGKFRPPGRTTKQIEIELQRLYSITPTNTAVFLSKRPYLTRKKNLWLHKYPYSKQGGAALKENKFTQIFDSLKLHSEVVKVSRKLFIDGHYAQAILEAFKRLNNYVKAKAKINDDGKSLMLKAFSRNSPVLKLNALSNQTDFDEQEGYMHIFAGTMLGIRNPKAHDNIVQKDPYKTLEFLSLASLLFKKVDESKI